MTHSSLFLCCFCHSRVLLDLLAILVLLILGFSRVIPTGFASFSFLYFFSNSFLLSQCRLCHSRLFLVKSRSLVLLVLHCSRIILITLVSFSLFSCRSPNFRSFPSFPFFFVIFMLFLLFSCHSCPSPLSRSLLSQYCSCYSRGPFVLLVLLAVLVLLVLCFVSSLKSLSSFSFVPVFLMSLSTLSSFSLVALISLFSSFFFLTRFVLRCPRNGVVILVSFPSYLLFVIQISYLSFSCPSSSCSHSRPFRPTRSSSLSYHSYQARGVLLILVRSRLVLYLRVVFVVLALLIIRILLIPDCGNIVLVVLDFNSSTKIEITFFDIQSFGFLTVHFYAT